jgi:hypothetical protein
MQAAPRPPPAGPRLLLPGRGGIPAVASAQYRAAPPCSLRRRRAARTPRTEPTITAMMLEKFVLPGTKGAANIAARVNNADKKVAAATAEASSSCCRALAWGMCFAALAVATTLCYQLSVLGPHIVRIANVAAAVQPAVPAIQAISESLSPSDATKIAELFHSIADLKSSADGMHQLLVTGSVPQLVTHILHENFGEIASKVSKALASATNAFLAVSKASNPHFQDRSHGWVNESLHGSEIRFQKYKHMRPRTGTRNDSGSSWGSVDPPAENHRRVQNVSWSGGCDPSNPWSECCSAQNQCRGGFYCDENSYCSTCDDIDDMFCDALGGCCSQSFKSQCGDANKCSSPPNVLKHLAKMTSFASSIVVKFVDLQPVHTETDADSTSQDSQDDHGMLLQFMEHAQDIAIQQTNLSEWVMAADACTALVDQLWTLDYQGGYYCDERRVNCSYYDYYNYYCNVTYAQECKWDANRDMKRDQTSILPSIREVCVALSSVLAHEVTPTSCTIMFEAACSQDKKLGLTQCTDCVHALEYPSSLVQNCQSASSSWCDPNGFGSICRQSLTQLCADAKRASVGNCYQCEGAHQAELVHAHCTPADLDEYCKA